MTQLLDNVSMGYLNEQVLTEQDFPGHYVNMARPEDYKLLSNPLQPELFYNGRANHFTLLLRASFAVSDKSFVPMTFVCSSGAPGGLYLCETALSVLSDVGRIKEDDLHNLYLQTENGKFAVTDMPLKHQSANIVGLPVLEKYGLMVSETPSFRVRLKF